MLIRYKFFLLLILSGLGFSHGVPQSTVEAMASATLMDYLIFGAEHMVTGYDHILFLIGVLFFLKSFSDIFKFITAFTIAHCITLVFATFYGITANPYLIDAVIAFSVIYKGFENLNGFKKWFSFEAPNLLLMVFIFGLIHGFGLSTKLQEIAVLNNINLSLFQILSFNLGVELGQIAILLVSYFLLLTMRGESFKKFSVLINSLLIILGTLLLAYQLNSFFNSDHHNHEINKKEHMHKKDKEKHSHGTNEHTH